MYFTPFETEHYNRHFKLPELGQAGQWKLKNARVLCIGAGGLGSSALLYLAAAGVGTIGIIDDDIVEASNLHRQVLYSYDDIGVSKVTAAKNKLLRLNPAIHINSYDARLKHENARDILSQYDVIVDGSDNYATRYVVNDHCLALKKVHVHASISQFAGQCTVLTAQNGACYRCLFPAGGTAMNCADAGVLGVLPGMMGTIQAMEVMKLILGVGEPLINRLLMFDALEMRFSEIAIFKNPDCQSCHNLMENQMTTIKEISVQELKQLKDNKAEFLLLDVREPSEYETCNLGGKLIPMSTLPDRLDELDKDQPIIVHCKLGGRSLRAADFLQSQGFANVSNLTGGIIAWIDKIDPTMKKY